MKTIVWLFLIEMFLSINALAQTEILPYAQEEQKKATTEWQSNLEFTIGYVPKSSIQALKTSFAINNILHSRFGVYTSLENGLDSGSFSNTAGITASVYRFVYLWGGLDLFTKSGFLRNNALRGIRKELGIGITPYRWSVVRLGWSSSVGYTVTAGIKIPL